MKRILVVGLTCVDIKSVVRSFPAEDTDTEAESQTWTTGGNGANTSRILAQHPDVQVFLHSGLSSLPQHVFVNIELQDAGVDISPCILHPNLLPTSTCILNLETSSRTILSSSNHFPSLKASDFLRNMHFLEFDWIHFEGRDFPDVGEMIQYVVNSRSLGDKSTQSLPRPVVSAEMEKVKRLEGLEKHVLPWVDVLFISKDIAQVKGYPSALETLQQVTSIKTVNATFIFCAWGKDGAAGAQFLDGRWTFSECGAFSCGRVVDTLGAGDTFNAGVVFALAQGLCCERALRYGCELAGRKCTQIGFQGLMDRCNGASVEKT